MKVLTARQCFGFIKDLKEDFKTLFIVCVYMPQHKCGKKTACGSRLSPSPCRFQGLNSGHQSLQQMPLPAMSLAQNLTF